MENTEYEILVDTAGAMQSLKALEGAAKGAGRAALALRQQLQEALSPLEQVNTWENSLLTLRLTLGKVRAALLSMVEPILGVLVPVLNRGLLALARFASAAGQVIGALLGVKVADTAAESMKNLGKTTTSTGKALKKALADFDEIDRLQFSGGGGGKVSLPAALPEAAEKGLPKSLQKLVERCRALLQRLFAPFRALDLTPLRRAMEALREALAPITRALFDGLLWAWDNLLVPLAKWTVEDAIPAFLQVLQGALEALSQVVEAVKPALLWLWQEFLAPLAQWAGEKVVQALNGAAESLRGLGQWVADNRDTVTAFAKAVLVLGAALALVGADGSTVLKVMLGISAAGAAIAALAQQIRQSWAGLVSWLGGLLEPVSRGFRSLGNSLIGCLNGMLSGVQGAVNSVVRAMNSLRFTVPSWVPYVGGNQLGFSLQAVSLPKIPYLAQGAVLPANRPFLAMVGDQHSGTNIEAPLATIQEAVALVLEEQLSGMLAGFQAVVEAIERKDTTLLLDGEAVYRANAGYARRLAVMQGG